jgi:hypothetical protein
MAQAQKPTRRTDKPAKIEQVNLPEPAETAPVETVSISSDEDVTLVAKLVDSIMADLDRATEAERGLEFGDVKMNGHRDANVKALQDCVAKLQTVNTKRHGWMHAYIEKALKAIEREEAAAKRAADKARKAAEKAEALEAAKALAAQEGK